MRVFTCMANNLHHKYIQRLRQEEKSTSLFIISSTLFHTITSMAYSEILTLLSS